MEAQKKYYMSISHHSVVHPWEECKSTNLTAAKREATKELGGGFNDHIIIIAVGDSKEIIAERKISSNKWIDRPED